MAAPTYKLDQSFAHRTATHEYRIKWTRIGNVNSSPVVFIHGTPWSSVVWSDLASSLSTRYCIYLYDHPGFGESTPFRHLGDVPEDKQDELDATLTRRAEASAALFKHWNLTTPPHVVCHDNAGLVSLRLFLQHDVKFTSLCMMDVVALGPFGLPFFKLVAENEDVFNAIPAHLAEGFVRGYVRSAMYKSMSKEIEDQLSAPWLASGTQGTRSFLREMIQAHNRSTTGLEDEYSRVSSLTSTKIIWGKDDAWIPFGTAQRLGDALKAEEVVIVEDAGHLIHYDQPSRLAVEVALWLTKHDKVKR